MVNAMQGDDSFLAAVERASVDDPVFGAWSAREFRGSKVPRGLVAATRSHEDYLIVTALDPEVVRIEPAPADAFEAGIPCPPDFLVVDQEGAETLVHVLTGENDEASKAALHDAYREAERQGLTYRVVEQSEICEEPRLRNARLVHACRRTRVGPGDRVRILHYLSESGESPLVEVSRVVSGSPDGVECVLALVVEGTVSVDLRRTLGPEMPVRRVRVESDVERE
jgi:hypothetical protein